MQRDGTAARSKQPCSTIKKKRNTKKKEKKREIFFSSYHDCQEIQMTSQRPVFGIFRGGVTDVQYAFDMMPFVRLFQARNNAFVH